MTRTALHATPTAASLVVMAVWFGIVSGFSEAVLLGIAKVGLGRFLFLGLHVAWMAPAFYALVLVPVALLLWLLSRLMPRANWLRIALGLFAFIGLFGSLLLFTRLWRPATAVLALGMAVALSARLSASARFLVVVRRTVLPFVGLVILTWAAIAGARMIAERRALAALPAVVRGPNVLLILLDTVRSLNLSLYGYGRATTPNLERLARRAVVFDQALSPAPWTLPSHTSLFTGRDPDRLDVNWTIPLGDGVPVLAEALAARGYQTAGFSSNAKYVGRESGLSRGFTHYEDFRESPGQLVMAANITRTWWWASARLRRLFRRWPYPGHKSAAHLKGDVLSWFDGRRDAARPFFVFMNYMDAHAPYVPPAPFDTVFGVKSARYDPELEQWFRRAPTPEEARDLLLAYDQSLAYLDHEVGALLDSLAARHLLDSTLIIVTSDHGEEFFEHGTVSHGHTLYLPSVAIPLIVALPGAVPEGRRVASRATLRDVAATILELVGAPNLAGSEGRSLSRHWTGEPPADTIYTEVRYAPGLPENFPVSSGTLRSAFAGPWHYIEVGTERRELFNLTDDPMERVDLTRQPSHGDSAAALARWLERRAAGR